MRSKLFVPASRPNLFAKALAGDADAISFDLEDAVEESRKADARAQLETFLSGVDPAALTKVLIVRVNALSTVHFAADMRAVIRPGLSVLNLPMVESAEDVRTAARLLAQVEEERGITTPIRILANIESPRGLRLAAEIAASHPRLMGLQLGFGDLFAPLGIDPADDEHFVPVIKDARDLHLIVAGGWGPLTAICHGWGGGSRAVHGAYAIK